MTELLIGCGYARDKRAGPQEKGPPKWERLVTMDSNADCEPDLLCDLDTLPWNFNRARDATVSDLIVSSITDDTCWNFADDSIDEIHAYEVLEHLGRQGDAKAFFGLFTEMWRILKPGGYIFATVPSRYSPWLWGDPSHTRAILPETLVFLSQEQYRKQCDNPAVKTAMSDFRYMYRADFRVVASSDNHVMHLFALQAIKPSTWEPR